MFLMKNKGQGTAIIIVLLVIIAVVLIVIAYGIFNKPSTTGQVVVNDVNENSPTETTKENFVEETCALSPPFVCKDSAIYNNGINLLVYNGGKDDVIIKRYSISNSDCGVLEIKKSTNNGYEDFIIKSGSEDTITTQCLLQKGTNFREIITIDYQEVGNDFELTSTGSVTGKVM